MKEKEKLIITLWRGQIDNPRALDQVYCKLNYHGQEHSSKPINAGKSLTWKQTFVFQLSTLNEELSLSFVNTPSQGEIHFAHNSLISEMIFGKSHVAIDLDNSNRGTVPAKLQISDRQNNNIGIIFLEYEIIKTQVSYIVEKLLDYEYLLKLSIFRISFSRQITTIPNFYLKFKYGDRVHKEDFAFQEFDGTYIYNYPVKLYMKKQQEIQIDVQIKGNYRKDYRNPNTSFDTQSNYSGTKSIKKLGNKKTPIDLTAADKLISILDLNYKKDVSTHVKLPLNIMVKNSQRQIGILEFDLQTIFKTKKEKEEFEIQKKRQMQLKNQVVEKEKKKQKKYEIPKNGSIILNSIIGKLQLFNEELVKNRDISIEVSLGKNTQLSTVLENPGKQLIWMDTFLFKRTWQQTVKFIVHVHMEDKKMPSFYSEVNIRDLFEKGRYMAKKLDLKDANNNYCGNLTIDMVYEEEEEKPKEISRKKVVVIKKSAEQSEMEEKEKKRLMIMERMKKRQEEKKRREAELEHPVSQNEIYLPPLRSSREIKDERRTLSPKRSANQSVNLYNKGGIQVFSKSPRFQDYKAKETLQLYFYQAPSDFMGRPKKGAAMGYGQKFDFTKVYEKAPGVGRYEIPSTWDKYK